MPHADHTVETTLDYFEPNADGSPPAVNDLELQFGLKNLNKQPVKVFDMRGEGMNLKKNGFEIFKHETKCSDFTDKDKIKAEYYPEMAEALAKAVGASKVLVLSHTVRTQPEAPKVSSATNFVDAHGPLRRVHIDTTHRTVADAVKLRTGPDFLDEVKGQWKLINAWRPLKTVRRDPLCVADALSVPQDDLVSVRRTFPNGSAEERYMVQSVTGADHKWFYCHEQQPDEVLLFNQFASKPGNTQADRVPHASFVIPGTEDMPTRESVELRCVAVFD